MFRKDAFYKYLRSSASSLFGKSLNDKQVEGLEAVLDYCYERKLPREYLAACLATDYHESGHTMQPVRETFATSDDQAIARLNKAFKSGKLPWVSKPYWNKDANGKSWYGRGLVQITHMVNYAKLSKVIGVDLVADPDKTLEMRYAVPILVEGMLLGSFTGRKLADVFDCIDENDAEQLREFTNSRPIINGKDRAAAIAEYALKFYNALEHAGWPSQFDTMPTTPKPRTVEEPMVAPNKPKIVPVAVKPAPPGKSLVQILFNLVKALFGGNK